MQTRGAEISDGACRARIPIGSRIGPKRRLIKKRQVSRGVMRTSYGTPPRRSLSRATPKSLRLTESPASTKSPRRRGSSRVYIDDLKKGVAKKCPRKNHIEGRKKYAQEKKTSAIAIPNGAIEKCIYSVRHHRVMLDSDLAELYDVPTHRLNEQVTRNLNRFPVDFMFQLNRKETDSLRSQIAISNFGRGGRRYLPRVFTEQGVSMLSSVLRSERAVQVNIAIMRAFVRSRQLMASHEQLARKIAAIECKYDAQFKGVFDAIRELMKPDSKSTRKIGFSDDD